MVDKCWLFYSRLGAYTLPWQENGREYRVFLDENGKLDELAVHESAREIAWHGGNAARMLPFWPHPKLEIIRYLGKRILEFNEKYFEDWRRIFEIYNLYDVVPFFELFDFCGTREGPGINNPWNVPFPGGTSETVTGNFFWGPESLWLRGIYIKKMLKITKGLRVGWGSCNEPRKPVPARFLAETFIQLIWASVDPGLIILPIDYARKEQKGTWSHKLYPEFKKLIQDELGENWDIKLKTDCISPMHNCTVDKLKEMWGPAVKPRHSRQMCYSLDGVKNPRPDKWRVKRIFSIIMQTKYKATIDGRVHFEAVSKQEGDPPDSMEGASEAYNDFYGKFPANWHVDKKITPPEEPPIEEPDEPVEPKPKEEEMIEVEETTWWFKFFGFIKRWWRWILAGIVIPASVYAVIFVSPLWYLLALPVLAGLVKFKIFRL